MTHPFGLDDIKDLSSADFTYEFLLDLHSLVGIDAVTEFGRILKEERNDLFFDYVVALQEYYYFRRQEENK